MIGIGVIAFLGPALLCLGLTGVVRRWATRRGFVDHPGGHKQHERVVALGGGAAIFLSVALPILVGASGVVGLSRSGWRDRLPALLAEHADGMAERLPLVFGILSAALVLHLVGLLDDRRPMGPWSKFGVQLMVALLTTGVLRVRMLDGFLPPVASMLVTTFWIVLITNAFNFLDNMDGLSAGVAAIAALVFAVASLRVGQLFVPALALVLAGALCGFLVHNFHPATVFMGDAGSLVIGYLLGVLTILTTYYDPRLDLTPLGIVVPMLVLAVPLYDVFSVVVHRVRLGESPLRGDRRHFSHRLLRKGLSVRGAVLTIYLATAATALPAVVLPQLDWAGACLLLAQTGCVLIMIAILEHAPGPSGDRPV